MSAICRSSQVSGLRNDLVGPVHLRQKRMTVVSEKNLSQNLADFFHYRLDSFLSPTHCILLSSNSSHNFSVKRQ